MGAVAFRARTDLRTKVRWALLLIVAIGIAGGASLTALAGARRTDTAVDRFVAYSRPTNGGVIANPALYPRIARLPGIQYSQVGARFGMVRVDAGNRPLRNNVLGAVAVADFGPGRPIILSGRIPRADRVDEAVVNASAATNEHLHVGDELRFRGYDTGAANALLRGTIAAPTGPIVKVRVVGVVRFPSDLSTAEATPDVTYTGSDTALLTPAFLRAYSRRITELGGPILSVQFTNPAAVPPFTAQVARLSKGQAQVFTGSDDLGAAAQAKHATKVETIALLLFGALAAIVTLLLIGQAFARQVYLDTNEYTTLNAMGMTRPQLVCAISARAALISTAGAIVAVGVAILASPRMPIGLARQAEVHPGYSVDGVVLAAGVVVIAGVLTASTAVVAWRATRALGLGASRRSARRAHASRIATQLSRSGSPPSATIGATMAFESGAGASSVPVRTATVSAVIAVAVVAGALTFGSNLGRLGAEPRLQGWNWDVAVGNPHSDDVSKIAIPKLLRNPDVAAFSSIATPASDLRVGGRDGGLFGIDAVKGPDLIPYTAGRAPRTANEVAFGPKTLRDLHLRIGDHVRASTGGPTRSLLVTGRALLTPVVVNDQIPLGQGALVTASALKVLRTDATTNVFLVRLRPGADRAAALRRLRADFPGTVLSAARPPDIENLRRVDRMPGLLAALFALIALLIVGNMLVSSVRRRRRDLAILRTIGFVRRQVTGAVIWQATMIAVVAIVIGIPVGVILGRANWNLVTDQFGLANDPIVPGARLVLFALATLFVINVVAIVPGLLATRTSPATILHAE